MNHYYFAEEETEAEAMINFTPVPMSALDLGITPKASFLPVQIKYSIFISMGSSTWTPTFTPLELEHKLSHKESWSLSVTKWPFSVAPQWHSVARLSPQAGRQDACVHG